MIKKISFLVAASLVTFSAHAYAPWAKNYLPKKYVRLETGFMVNNQIERDNNTSKYSTNNTTFGGAAIGYEFLDEYRGEINILYTPTTKTKIQKSGGHAELQTTNIAGLANIYFAPKDTEQVSPYVFFGLGFTSNRTSYITDYTSSGGLLNVQEGRRNTHLAWNAGFGITLYMTERTMFDIGYRFINYGTFKSKLSGTYGPAHASNGTSHKDETYNYNFGQAKSYQVTVGLRYFVN
ncbi:MAG: porin family protein [Rickettsiaceae bacterium]|nr:porin family protein [Rickettsiaceae bacterium]